MDIDDADRLADHADALALLEPRSQRALRSAEESVAAAHALVARDAAPGGRSRLARALWRLTAAQTGNDPEAAPRTAARCWTVCATLLDRPDPADQQGPLVARIAYWLGTLIPVLSQAGQMQQVSEAIDRVARAAQAVDADNGARAIARLNMFVFTAGSDDFAQARAQGRLAEIAEPLARMIDHVAATCRIFQLHATDGPYEASEFAQTLCISSRLMFVAGNLTTAAALLDQAQEVAAGFTDLGPAFRTQADNIRRERDALTRHLPRTR